MSHIEIKNGTTTTDQGKFLRRALPVSYTDIQIKKKNGKMRMLTVPSRDLKLVQQEICERILNKIPVHDAAHGFVKGRSTLTHAKLHVGKPLVITIDLKDFFESITEKMVEAVFRREIATWGIIPGETVASMVAAHVPPYVRLTTYCGSIPQGAPTSPALSNLVCRNLDLCLSMLAGSPDSFGERFTYSRYADDLAFSFKKPPDHLYDFFRRVESYIREAGFSENRSKRRIMKASGRQEVTGLVVNERVSIRREDRRKLRATIHQADEIEPWLEGYCAHVDFITKRGKI